MWKDDQKKTKQKVQQQQQQQQLILTKNQLPLCWNDHCGFLSVEPYLKRDRKTLKSLGRDSSRKKYKIQEISLTWSYMARFLSSFNTCKKEFIN